MRLKTLLLSFVIPVIFVNLVAIRTSFAQANPLCLITLSEISLVYNSDVDGFTGSVTIGNDYFCVATMAIRLEGPDNLQISEQTYGVSGDQVNFQFDGSRLMAGQKHFITAIPLNDANEIFATEDEQIQVKKEFIYTPKGPDPLTVKVNSVNPNHEQGTLTIDLDISDDSRVVSYEGFITDVDSGGTVHTIESRLYNGLRIEEALAANNPIRTSQEPHEYRLTFCVNTKDDSNSQKCADPYEFKPALAPQGTIWEKIFKALSHPATSASVLIILMSTIGWVIVRNSRTSGEEPKLRRPPIGGTDIINRRERSSSGSGGSHAAGSITVQIVRAPGSVNLKKHRISRFPFTIGRDGCSLNINDPHISKPHLEISLREGNYYLKDLGSTNHTFVAEREIAANKLVSLRDVTLVRLGPNTEIEVEVNG